MSDTMTEVTDATFEAEVLRADRPVVVDFWAPWCGPCRMMDPVFDELSQSHAGVKFAKVNVDENPATAARYQILSIPTVLVLRDGEVEKQLIGALPKGKLTSELSPWLGAAAA